MVEIKVFGHTVFSFTVMSIPQGCLKTGQAGAGDRPALETDIELALLPTALFPLSLATYFSLVLLQLFLLLLLGWPGVLIQG